MAGKKGGEGGSHGGSQGHGHGHGATHAPTVQEIVSDQLTKISLEYWAGKSIIRFNIEREGRPSF